MDRTSNAVKKRYKNKVDEDSIHVRRQEPKPVKSDSCHAGINGVSYVPQEKTLAARNV